MNNPLQEASTRLFSVLFCFCVLASSSLIVAAEGDPPIEVPTLEQGRAILMRDSLHRQCEQAFIDQDWKRLVKLSDKSLQAEQDAFGHDFEGTETTKFYQAVGKKNTGNTVKLPVMTSPLRPGDMPGFNPAFFSEDQIKRLSNATAEAQKKAVTEITDVYNQLIELTTLWSQSLSTGEFVQLDEEALKLASRLDTLRDQAAKKAAERMSMQQEQRRLLKDQAQSAEVPTTQTVAENPFDDAAFNWIYLLASNASVRANDHRKTLQYSKHAFEVTRKANSNWHEDDRPWIGSGQIIARNYRDQLIAAAQRSRAANQWGQVVKLISDCEKWAGKLDSEYKFECITYLEEANAVLKLSKEDRERYIEKVVRPKLFQPSDSIEVQLEKLLTRRIDRMALIGVTEQDAFDANSAAVFYSRLNRPLDAAKWARRALHQFLLKRGADNRWVKTSADNYLGQLGAFAVAHPSDLSKEFVAELVQTWQRLKGKAGNHPVVAQYEIAAAKLQRQCEFSDSEKQKKRKLDVLRQQRNQHFQKGQYDLCLPLSKRSVELSGELWGTGAWIYADDRRVLANCLTKLGRPAEALAILSQIKKDFDRFPFNQTSDFGWFLHGYAFGLRNQGKQESFPLVIETLEQARDLSHKISGEFEPYAAHTELLAETLRDFAADSKAALPLFQEAVEVYLGMGDIGKWGHCQSLVNVGLCQTNLGLYEAAEKHLSESLQIRKTLDVRNPHMEAWNHWARGGNAFFMHQFDQSIEHMIKAVEIKEEFTPTANDIDDIHGQIIRASCWKNDGSHREHIDRFIQSAQRRHGGESNAFANACQTASSYVHGAPDPGTGLTTDAQFEAIEELNFRALEIYREREIAESRQAIYALKGYADSLRNDPLEALQTYDQVIRLAKQHEPVLWDAIGFAHLEISNLERDINGSMHATLRHRRQAAVPLTKAFGDYSSQVARVKSEQAAVLVVMGDFDNAEKLLSESLEISLASGRNPVDIHLELSDLYRLRGNLDQAEQYLYIARNMLGQRKFSAAFDRRIRVSLGKVALDRGKFDLAKTIASDLLEEATGENREASRVRFISKALLGRALLGLRHYKQAHELLTEVVQEVTSHAPGKPRSLSPDTRRAYALSCLHVGDTDRSHQLLLAQLRDTIKQHRASATELTPRQQLGLRRAIDDSLSAYLSFAVNSKRSPESIYENIFDVKGIVSSHQRRFAIDDDDAPQWKEAVTELTNVNRELSAALFGTTVGDSPRETVAEIQRLTAQRENLQLKLAKMDRKKNDAKTKQPMDQPTVDDLRSILDGEAHLIDFVIYNHFHDFTLAASPNDPLAKEHPRCLAFIVARNGVEMVDLTSLEHLQEGILAWRESIEEDRMFADASRTIRQRLWEPLEPHIPRQGRLLLATDGPLQQLAFAAISDGKKGFLIDHYNMTLVPSPRFLLKRRVRGPAVAENQKDQILLVGDVNYFRPNDETVVPESLAPTQAFAMSTVASSLRAERAGSNAAWAPLDGTADEIDAIANTMSATGTKATVHSLAGHDANEAAVGLLAQESRILHLATHGFFAEASEDSGWQLQSLSRRAVSGFDPQLLTGVVLAGANAPPEDGKDDGILTAAEIETLDLSGNELTVLSACETALGETASGEGVLGLQRALHLAGSRNVVASLWNVDDNATMILMTLFYKNLLEKEMSKADALREAQLWMLDHPEEVNDPDTVAKLQSRGTRGFDLKKSKSPSGTAKRLAPKYWAAFSLSGDWE